MSRVSLSPVETPEIADMFAEISAMFGMVPNLFRVYANHPPLLQANWNKAKAVLGAGSLSMKAKQAIAVLVSRDNGCSYCVAAHRGALQSMGISSEEIKTIEEDLEKAEFSSKELALISFARKANANPLRIADDEFSNVTQAGATDAEIIEALGVMELFTAFNKLLDSLQIDNDFA
jgi:uncharacterized peroxidase-related enzyme